MYRLVRRLIADKTGIYVSLSVHLSIQTVHPPGKLLCCVKSCVRVAVLPPYAALDKLFVDSDGLNLLITFVPVINEQGAVTQ